MAEIRDRRKKDWFWASDRIFEMDRLTEHDIIVYLFLCRKADGDGRSFPSRKEIAKKCRISVDTVDRSLKNLEREELLKKWNRKNGVEYTSNLYEIYDPPEPVAQEQRENNRGVAAESGQVTAGSGNLAAETCSKDNPNKDYPNKDNNNRFPDKVPVEKSNSDVVVECFSVPKPNRIEVRPAGVKPSVGEMASVSIKTSRRRSSVLEKLDDTTRVEIERVRNLFRAKGISVALNEASVSAMVEWTKFSDHELIKVIEQINEMAEDGEVDNPAGLLVAGPNLVGDILKGNKVVSRNKKPKARNQVKEWNYGW